MPKKIKFEAFVYRFLAEASVLRRNLPAQGARAWDELVERLVFTYDAGKAVVTWEGASTAQLEFSLGDADLYHRGDTASHVAEQRAHNLLLNSDSVQQQNAEYFREAVSRVARSAGLDSMGTDNGQGSQRLRNEEAFHDQWASSEDPSNIDVLLTNEACTSPELRYIRVQLGDLAGKRVLDVGCGLGEVSVYLALKGASVTAMDLSEGMLATTSRLADRYGVDLRTHKSAAEGTNLPPSDLFDVIYAGNLLHHVDIEQTIKLLKPHLAPGGVFVSWDPIAYNPLINIYRSIATEVRTPDEHPLKLSDIRMFRREFRHVSTRYFWLTTLGLFVWMAIGQRRSPNKERFWKVVIKESERWKPVYRPLELVDNFVLWAIPPLRLLCWNVVIVARDPSIN